MKYQANRFHPKYALMICDALFAHKLAEAHLATQSRLMMHKQLREMAEGGMIALVEHGRDCDGVQYSNRVRMVKATAKAIDEEIDSIQKWADGPFWVNLDRPSVAKLLDYESRDLVAEASENGHPWAIHA